MEKNESTWWPTEPENSFLGYLFSGEPKEEVIQGYLKNGVNLNSIRGGDRTLLMHAILKAVDTDNDFPAIKLIDLGADISIIWPDGSCALDEAITFHRPGIVKRLLDAGANPNFVHGHFSWSLLDKADLDLYYHGFETPEGQTIPNEYFRTRMEVIVDLLKKYGAKPFDELRTDTLMYWLNMFSNETTGLCTLFGYIEIEKLGVPVPIVNSFTRWKNTFWDSWQIDYGPRPPAFDRKSHNDLGETIAREIRKYLSDDIKFQYFYIDPDAERNGGRDIKHLDI